MGLTVAQNIEAFHLSFLSVLRTKVDERGYVLKGGANLRYFFDSVRYSEDIDFDLDLDEDRSWRFVEAVTEVLASPALKRLLAVPGIAIDHDTTALKKDTKTTKRWRAFFAAPGHDERLRTKIEFSLRNGETRLELATVPNEIARPYALRPPSVQHYLIGAAIKQKIEALAKRPETQARDVFDLELLFRRESVTEGDVSNTLRKAAADAAVALTYADFEAQVRPFLDSDVAAMYDQPTWETMQHFVVTEVLP